MANARTSITVSEEALEQAKFFGVNVSKVCDEAIKEEVRIRKRQDWRERNKKAMDRANADMEKDGVFGEQYGVMFNETA